ncbi:MAG: hypothetical protein Q9218_003492 [Villophora microphyllina]
MPQFVPSPFNKRKRAYSPVPPTPTTPFFSTYPPYALGDLPGRSIARHIINRARVQADAQHIPHDPDPYPNPCPRCEQAGHVCYRMPGHEVKLGARCAFCFAADIDVKECRVGLECEERASQPGTARQRERTAWEKEMEETFGRFGGKRRKVEVGASPPLPVPAPKVEGKGAGNLLKADAQDEDDRDIHITGGNIWFRDPFSGSNSTKGRKVILDPIVPVDPKERGPRAPTRHVGS